MSTIQIRCPVRKGLISIGPYKPGQVYDVEEAEASRLVSVKGFTYVDPPPDPDPEEEGEE